MTHNKSKSALLQGTCFAALLIELFIADYALPQTPYEDKTITVIVGSGAGGSLDQWNRAAVSVFRRHVPGNPAVVMEYMPGAGGRRAANHIYKAARPDGLTIGALSGPFITDAIFGEVGVVYDIHKFIYLGAIMSGSPRSFFTRKAAGLDSLEKLRDASGVRIGARAVGHALYLDGRIFAYLIGMREPKFVVGYGGEEILVGLMRGEVDAYTQDITATLQRHSDWVEKGLMDFHATIELPKGRKHPHPLFARLPDLENFAKSDRERKFLTLARTLRWIGQPWVLPPGTPEDRVQILREAMAKAFKDPEYNTEFKKLAVEEPKPLAPEELEDTVRRLPRDPDILDLFKKLNGPDPLPPRR
ncbi:MAG: hypothetical protein HY695_20190 [Deltaproteobacteria bacterium]|nr:hypothetical protein [Deltaproteobacteria bacterium]